MQHLLLILLCLHYNMFNGLRQMILSYFTIFLFNKHFWIVEYDDKMWE